VKPNLGDRVLVTGILPDDPNPLPIGSEGTVDWLGSWTSDLTRQIGVKWDDPKRALLLLDTDPFVVLP